MIQDPSLIIVRRQRIWPYVLLAIAWPLLLASVIISLYIPSNMCRI